MIKALSADPEVARVFAHAIRGGRFRDRFEAVATSFPLPSFSDLLRINTQYNWRGPRDDAFWAEIGRAVAAGKKVRVSPQLKPDNPSWKEMLDCTYKVRCNLVHSGKMVSADEAEFVSVFADLLHDLRLIRK